jgi:rhamnogalacturonyl hydrolase YesR
MQRLMDLQPNYPAQMHTTYSRAKGIHTEPDPGDDVRRYIFNLDATTDERFFNPGIAAGFLARLYMATGEDQWLQLAKEYMRCCDNASDYLYTILRAGKTGWAAALLYTLTGERKYRDIAVRIGETLLRTQAESGYWSGLDSIEETPSYGRTAEMTIWLDEIYQAVGHESDAESTVEPSVTATQRA